MNGRTDLVRHIEKCEKCQQRQEKFDKCRFESTADKLKKEMELCCIETELKNENQNE